MAYIAIQQYIKLNGNMYSTYKKEKDFFFVFLDVEYVLGALCKKFFLFTKLGNENKIKRKEDRGK